MITENQIRAAIGEEARRLLRPMPNIMLANHDAGTQETSGHEGVNAPAFSTRRIEAAEGGAPEAYPEPWSFSFDGAEVEFSDCIFMRGPVTVEVDPAPYTVTGDDGDIWISAKINTETHECEIIEGASLADVTDRYWAVPSDEYVKVPLLKLTKATAGEGESAVVSLSVALDLRRMMCLMLYV